ncbi:hypothetical protein AYX15_06942 [Cryptococcus neoformans]|nr:hypothetical protein AYX15_06942 [Cryptococcus neoformans var. grubii]
MPLYLIIQSAVSHGETLCQQAGSLRLRLLGIKKYQPPIVFSTNTGLLSRMSKILSLLKMKSGFGKISVRH